jgi:hypothetical protein
MLMNKQQTCGFFGWTSAEFNCNLSKGFPARKKTPSRGENWVVDSRNAVDWVVAQELGRPQSRKRGAGRPDHADVPPAWEAFESVEAVEDPMDAVAMVSVLAPMHALPRLVANVTADEGVSIDRVHRISVGTLIIAMEYCRSHYEY